MGRFFWGNALLEITEENQDLIFLSPYAQVRFAKDGSVCLHTGSSHFRLPSDAGWLFLILSSSGIRPQEMVSFLRKMGARNPRRLRDLMIQSGVLW